VISQRGVVDENIDAAEAGDYLTDHRFHVSRFRNVAQHEHCFLACLIDLIDHGLAALFVHFDNRDLGTLCGE
jgi:hypothetical protein